MLRFIHSPVKFKFLNILSSFYSTKIMNTANKNKLYLRHEQHADHFQATLNWSCKTLNIEREFNFNRRLHEKVEDFLTRIKVNIEKIVLNKVKKKKKKQPDVFENVPEEVGVKLFYETMEICTDDICEEVFFSNLYDPNKLMLKVMDTTFNIAVNPPWIVRLLVPSPIMVNFPIYPTVEIKFGTKCDSDFTWYTLCKTSKNWMECGKSLMYTPLNQQIGQKLKLKCVPGNGKTFGPEMSVEANTEVKLGPELCNIASRHAFTKDRLPMDRFRVVTYNILADLYAETVEAKTNLFSYCPPDAICLDYRKQLYIHELLGYNSDIICLQEVDVKVFENGLQDVLSQQNLKGVITRKKASVAEGVATFYSLKKFRLIDSMVSELGNEIDTNPIYKPIYQKIKVNAKLFDRFKERGTVLQVQILESLWNPKEKIIVGNTHLFFHPNADHIRLLQAGLILLFLEDVVSKLKLLFPSDNLSLIMCGDFNSTPDSGIYRLMTDKFVSTQIDDWKSAEGEEVSGVELKHPFSFDSAYGTPPFTNYTEKFAACLDYIYFQTDNLKVLQVVPLPDEEVLKANVAIPSKEFPSDHVALVADFEWNSQST